MVVFWLMFVYLACVFGSCVCRCVCFLHFFCSFPTHLTCFCFFSTKCPWWNFCWTVFLRALPGRSGFKTKKALKVFEKERMSLKVLAFLSDNTLIHRYASPFSILASAHPGKNSPKCVQSLNFSKENLESHWEVCELDVQMSTVFLIAIANNFDL